MPRASNGPRALHRSSLVVEVMNLHRTPAPSLSAIAVPLS